MANSKSISSSSDIFPQELSTGLRNYWYPIFISKELPADKPVAIRRLGEDLALWRATDGKPKLFVDHCPHRGAPLSLGRLDAQGRLECWYHGLAFDETGQCRFVPFERQEDGPSAKGYRVQSYPAEDCAGYIWAYIGDVEMFPPPPLVMEPEVAGSEYHALPYSEPPWDAAWPVVVDNANDPHHVAFLHRDSAAPFIPAEKLFDFGVPTKVKVQVTEGDIRIGGCDGIRVLQIAERKVGGDEFEEFHLPTMNKIAIVAPGGEPIMSIRYTVPIDEQQTQNYWYICRKVKNDKERQEWEKAYYERLESGVRKIFAEDKAMTEGQGAVEKARSNERLLKVDRAVVRIRRLIIEAWQAQQPDAKAQAN